MAKYGKRGYSGNSKRNFNSKSSHKKYTTAEKTAFELGQRQRVIESIKSGNKNSRVYDAYCKGLNGKPTSKQKPLFG